MCFKLCISFTTTCESSVSALSLTPPENPLIVQQIVFPRKLFLQRNQEMETLQITDLDTNSELKQLFLAQKTGRCSCSFCLEALGLSYPEPVFNKDHYPKITRGYIYPDFSPKQQKQLEYRPSSYYLNDEVLTGKLYHPSSTDYRMVLDESNEKVKFSPLEFKCERCPEHFPSAYHLQLHLEMHKAAPPPAQNYYCEKCNKTFRNSRAYDLHIRRHTGIKPFKCKQCSKSFYQPSERAVHMRTHTGVRPYQCQYCLKAFRYSGDLKQHINIHTGSKPYKCEHCPKAFTNHSTLRQHRRIHTGEKPYKCKICSKLYRYHSSLKQHMFVHQDQKERQNKTQIKADVNITS